MHGNNALHMSREVQLSDTALVGPKLGIVSYIEGLP